MTSAIEIVSLSGDNMTSPKKRVRKAIVKPKIAEKSEKMAEKLEKPFPEPIIQQKIAEKLEKPFPEPIIQPKNDATNIPSEESAPKKSKKSSARGAKLISGGNNDSALDKIAETSGKKEMIVAENSKNDSENSSSGSFVGENSKKDSFDDVEMSDAGAILQEKSENSSENSESDNSRKNSPEKRSRGRPIGSKDKEKRRKKGEVIKPPVQHGKLGRPPGSKNKAVEIEEAIIPSTPASLIPPLAASSSVASAAARNVVASAYIPQPRPTRPAPNCRETFRQLEANHLGSIVSKMFHA